MGAPAITHRNPSPVLDPAKHVLNMMALFVEDFIIGECNLTVSFGRNAGLDSLRKQRLTIPIRTIPPVSFFAHQMRLKLVGSILHLICRVDDVLKS